MKLRCFGLVLSAFVFFLPGVAQADPVGTVVEVEGTATLSKAGGAPFATKINDTIDMGDVVATGAKSRLFILLADNTEWTLSENSKFRVDEYVYDPDDSADNKARYSVLDGGFRYVSGMIAHKANPDVAITSPAGTIGIRGTDLTGSPDDTGAYDFYVDDGAVDVANAGTTARLAKGEGTTVANRRAAPGKPGEWKHERLNRLRGMLHLQHEGQLRERIQQLQPRQTELREKFRARAKERHGKMQERSLDQKDERQQKAEQWREKFNGNQGDRQQKLEERKDQLQDNRGGMNDERQQRIQKIREQYSGGGGGTATTPAPVSPLKEKAAEWKEQRTEQAADRKAQVQDRKEAIADKKEQLQDKREQLQEKKTAIGEKIDALKEKRLQRRAGRKTGDGDDNADDDTPEKKRLRGLRNRGN